MAVRVVIMWVVRVVRVVRVVKMHHVVRHNVAMVHGGDGAGLGHSLQAGKWAVVAGRRLI